MEKTKVIYRTWENGSVIALFPELPSDRNGHYCMSYEHVGQHGGASTGLVQAHTRRSTHNEIKPLAQALTSIGYDLDPRLRETPNMRQARMKEAHKAIA